MSERRSGHPARLGSRASPAVGGAGRPDAAPLRVRPPRTPYPSLSLVLGLTLGFALGALLSPAAELLPEAGEARDVAAEPSCAPEEARVNSRSPTGAADAGAERRARDLEARVAQLEQQNRALRVALEARRAAVGGGPEASETRGAVPSSVDAPEGRYDSDLGPFEMTRLEGPLEPAAARLRDRFREVQRRVLDLEDAADRAGRGPSTDAELRRETSALWDELRRELPAEEYLAGLYAASRDNRLSVAAGRSTGTGGLEPGDVLLAIGTERVFDLDGLTRALTAWSGTGASVRVLRGGRELWLPLEALDGGVEVQAESVPPDAYYAPE